MAADDPTKIAARWELRGWLAGACLCETPCPCWFDAPPTHGRCDAIGAARVEHGHFESVDLGGCTLGVAYRARGNIWAGGLTAVIYIGMEASEEQAQAITTITTGQAGGLFAILFQLVEDFKGVRRTGIALTAGPNPAFRIGPGCTVPVTPIIGRDGVTPIEVHNAKMSFGGYRMMGKTRSRFIDTELGWDWELNHADWGPIHVFA